MTSRPSAGSQRQPQRSLSGTGMVQRPTALRSLSQQYPSSTPILKPENSVDLTLEGSEAGRYGSSRIGGSRLKLELSKDSKDGSISLESPKAIDVTPDQFISRSPRGRPRLQFWAGRPQLQGANDSSLLSSIRGVENISGQSPMPMPKRPGQSAPPSMRGHRLPPANPVKKDVRPKPYVLEVPPGAPHYHPNGYADFFPWTGDHPEDQFTDHVIRQGFYDKPQATQNESGSAKVSIFPALKHKSGLQTLSSLFTSVLSQRRTHGQITATPTFKPPPRVTLTDTKRETWLRDLANPSISLRRLSRTIPHGIRGKVLLEQCLSKKIPTERAVWLAKCVGANEIRAFKRKGVTGTFAMGGEAKWIRDWTIFVEQFVESIVASCGEADWKPMVLYVIRLAAHLYSEHLLDREHYMDWLSASLESCSLAKAPMWLLITQVYWSDLLKYRKYGRRLVAAICEHLQMAHETPDRDLLLPLIERMTVLLKGLLETHSESFISPKMWIRYKKTLASCVSPDHQHETIVYKMVDQRNERLTPPGAERDLSCRRLLIELLDMSLVRPFPNDLPQKCRQVMTDLPTLARTVLEWSTSLHRPSVAKVYVGARLLRTWGRLGIEVSDSVLEFLGSQTTGQGLCKPSLYHLVSELARSGHFSISKYLQWLIARGGVRGPTDIAKDGPCATRLLAELPTHGIPGSIDRLRRTMLGRASFSIDQELEETKMQIAVMETCLPRLSNHFKPELVGQVLTRPNGMIHQRSNLSQAIKSEIGVWLRKQVSLCIVHPAMPSTNEWKEENCGAKSAITSSEFNIVRAILEDIEDLSMLADVLKIVTRSDDVQVLASTADTLSFHVEAFASIGALNDLFDELLTRLRSLAEDTDSAALLMSLSNLAVRLPGAEQVAKQLTQELAQSNRKTAADACSPVSDHMAEVLQNSESEFSDEIEKILVSGTSMDQSTLERLFEMIILRMEASWTKTTLPQHNCALLLAQLRYFGVKQFDFLMTAWLRRFLQISNRPTLIHVLGPLLSAGCLEFRDVIISSTAVLESDAVLSNPLTASKAALDTLTLLLGTSDVSNFVSIDDAYRLGVKRLHFQKDCPKEALSVIRRAVELNAPSSGYEQASLASICQSGRLQSFLQHVTLNDLNTVVQGLITPLARSSSSEIRVQLSNIVKHLLNPAGDNTQEQTVACRIENALRLADDLTLPFCQLELHLIFATEALEWSDDENDATGCLEAFERAVDSAIASNNTSWTSIVTMLDVRIARHLCQRAERLLLQLVPSMKVENSNTRMSAESDELAKRLLFVVDATTYSMQANRTPHLASQIVEKLNDIWQMTSQGGTQSQSAVTGKWLPLILDFITLHINLFDTSKNGAELRSRMLLSLSAILLELKTHSNRNNNSQLLQRIFDIALLLVDDLPDEARLQCIRSLKDKTSDHGICYIFGYSAPPTDWLQLSQKGKLAPYPLRRWEVLSEPTPNVGENDTSLSLTLFKARKV